MKCHVHVDRDAVATCVNCEKGFVLNVRKNLIPQGVIDVWKPIITVFWRHGKNQ